MAEPQITAQQQCWECQRRRRKCDMIQPVCNVCSSSGIVCPGYGASRPLTWIKPGQILSRPRKKLPKSSKNAELEAKQTQSCMTVGTLQPILHTESDDITQALTYYNDLVFPRLHETQLAINPFTIPVKNLHVIPTSALHALVVLSLIHRRNSTASSNKVTIRKLSKAAHHHTDIAIRSLKGMLDDEFLRHQDAVLASIMVMLLVDITQSLSQNWRSHILAINAIVEARDGIDAMSAATPHTAPVLISCSIVHVLSNTTSPASNQSCAIEHLQSVDCIEKLYSIAMYPSFLCPSALFASIIRINYLRSRSACAAAEPTPDDYKSVAGELLTNVVDFSSKAWAQKQGSRFEEWNLIAELFHSAVCIYGLLALEKDAMVFKGLAPTRSFHQSRLMSLLKVATQMASLRYSIMWPLMVAGVGVVKGSGTEQKSLADILSGIVRDPMVPATKAKDVLERFWAFPGEGKWDDCFDRPYALVV